MIKDKIKNLVGQPILKRMIKILPKGSFDLRRFNYPMRQFRLIKVVMLLLAVNIQLANAQEVLAKADIENVQDTTKIANDKGIYSTVDQMPEFVGGATEMHQFILVNLRHPHAFSCEYDPKPKKVFVRFVVQADGRLTDVVILRGVSAEIDAEAIRVVEAMPKWIAGRHKGEAVPVYFILPILFERWW